MPVRRQKELSGGRQRFSVVFKNGSKLSTDPGLLWGWRPSAAHQRDGVSVPWAWWTLLHFFKYSTLDKFISSFTVPSHRLMKNQETESYLAHPSATHGGGSDTAASYSSSPIQA